MPSTTGSGGSIGRLYGEEVTTQDSDVFWSGPNIENLQRAYSTLNGNIRARSSPSRNSSTYETRLEEMRTRNAGNEAQYQYDCVCRHCLNFMNTNRENAYNTDRGVICETCKENHFGQCDCCGNCDEQDKMLYDSKENTICEKCAKRFHTKCKTCGHFIKGDRQKELAEYNKSGHCALCITNDIYDDTAENIMPTMEGYEDSDREPRGREYNRRKLASCISEEHGDILRSSRIFSTEIECLYPSNKKFNRAWHMLPTSLGASGDGSVSTQGSGAGGIEFQTPMLAGKKGEDYINRVGAELTRQDFKTNATCGLHVHLSGGKDFICGRHGDINNANGERVKTLMLFYMKFENVIHSFLPKSRRANRYCKSVKSNYSEADILNAESLETLERTWYNASTRAYVSSCKKSPKHGTRYCGVNLHTLLSQNHLEIRYHSGTVNPRKIMEWVNMHALIMDRVADGGISRTMFMDADGIINLEEKTSLFYELVGLTEPSQKYFNRRQKKFTAKNDESEEAEINAE